MGGAKVLDVGLGEVADSGAFEAGGECSAAEDDFPGFFADGGGLMDLAGLVVGCVGVAGEGSFGARTTRPQQITEISVRGN